MSKRKVESKKTLTDYLDAAVVCLEKMADSLDKLVYLWSVSAEALEKQTKTAKGK